MFFSQTSRKPADSLASATLRALSNRCHASFPSWSSSAARKGWLPSTAASVLACLLFQLSQSIPLEPVTASTLGFCTSLFEELLYRIAWNLELRAPASLPHAPAGPKHFAITSIASPFCRNTEERSARSQGVTFHFICVAPIPAPWRAYFAPAIKPKSCRRMGSARPQQ